MRIPGLGPPSKPRRSRVLVWALLAVLGFAITVSVRANSGDAGLTNARQEDLVRILDDLDAKGQRLQREVDRLELARDQLSGADSSAAALADAEARADGLAILAGTVGAQGPGIVLTVDDPQGQVGADTVVDAIEELRDAGAEAMQIDGGGQVVRIVASTAVVDDAGGGLSVDGHHLVAPYHLNVIGDAHTLAQAMQIPGGVLDTVATRAGAVATVQTPTRVTITATRALPASGAARPTH